VARDGAVKARSAALCQLGDLITTAPAELRERLTKRSSLEGKATLCRQFRVTNTGSTGPYQAAKLALRSIARRIADLNNEITALSAELDRLVAIAAPTTITRLGIGTGHAATLLVAAGENIDRLHSEAAFAHLCGVAPIPASSGRTTRHRLNYNGNRQANKALHMIVIVRLRYCPETQAYMARRLTEGRTKKKSSDVSNATSSETSTAPSEPTSQPSKQGLDIYRNVPGRITMMLFRIIHVRGFAVRAQRPGG
jgi:transposase